MLCFVTAVKAAQANERSSSINAGNTNSFPPRSTSTKITKTTKQYCKRLFFVSVLLYFLCSVPVEDFFNAEDKDGSTALGLAKMFGHTEVVKLLEDYAASAGIELVDKTGSSNLPVYQPAEHCVVCFTKLQHMTLLPCGHVALCRACTKDLQASRHTKCPLCRKKLESGTDYLTVDTGTYNIIYFTKQKFFKSLFNRMYCLIFGTVLYFLFYLLQQTRNLQKMM